MMVVDTYVGNAEDDPAVEMRLGEEGAKTVKVNEAQRRRSRFKATAEDGTDVGVVVPFGGPLRAGDVFAGDDGLVRVELAPRDALVVDLGALEPADETLLAAVDLAHALGARDRAVATRGCRLFVPVADDADADRLRSLVAEHLPEAETRREEVDPAVFDGTAAEPGLS